MAASSLGAGQPGERREGAGGERIAAPDPLQRVPVAVVIAEAPGGRLLHVSPEAERIWRRSLDGIGGVGEYDAWQGIHPDGSPLRPEEWPLARTVLHGETIEGRDVHIVRGDGARAVVRITSTPIPDGVGGIAAGVMRCIDVTSLRSEESARLLRERSMTALSAVADREGVLREIVRLMVPELADWCSIDLVSDDRRLERRVVGHNGDEGVKVEAPRPCPVWLEADPRLARILQSGAAALIPDVDASLLEVLAHDRRTVHLLRGLKPCCAVAAPLVSRGRCLGLVVLLAAGFREPYGAAELELVRELAWRAGLALDNAQLAHESQAAIRAKADFLAVISHELRTPLTAIIGYAELLSLGVPEPVTERQREQIERIEFSGRHLLTLIEEILTMANLEKGWARARNEPVEVADLLRRVEARILPLAAAKGLSLHVGDVEPGLVVRSDPERLLQVLLNLLSNAVKFTERGRIHVDARREAADLVVRVRDSGIGIDPRHRERIFEPFWQVEKPITRRAGGTGLGLAISRRQMELLGGRLEIEDSAEGGSSFVVRLPVGERVNG